MWREDPLTGLAERGGLEDLLKRVAVRVEREGIPVACAVADMDDFKAVNDTFGHAEGDRVLQAFGQYVRKRLRPGVHILRLGGDEFLILFEGRSRSSASRTLRRWIQDLSVHGLAGHAVGLSAGLAGIPDDTTDVYELLPLADQALYLAKARGKGTLAYPAPRRVRLNWPPSYVPRPVEQRTLATLLRERSVVVIRGPEGAGKTRFVQEVLRGRATLWRPGAAAGASQRIRTSVVVVDDAHTLTDAEWARVGRWVQEGKTCVLVVPDRAFSGIQFRLQPLFLSYRVGELRIPPMHHEFPRLVERALGGVVPGGLTEDLFELSGGLPGLVGSLLRALVNEGLLAPAQTHWVYPGIPPGFYPADLVPLWERRIRDLSPGEKTLLGILAVMGGEAALAELLQGADEEGVDSPEEMLGNLEEKGWIHTRDQAGREIVSFREKAWVFLAHRLLSPQSRKRVMLWALENARMDSGIWRLYLLSQVDDSAFRTAYRKTLKNMLATLDIRGLQRLLLVIPEKDRDDPLVLEASLWLLRATGRFRELVRQIPEPPPENLRWIYLSALGDLGKIKQAMQLAEKWEREADPLLQSIVGWVYLVGGQPDRAKRVFSRLIRSGGKGHRFALVQALYAMGEMARQKGQNVQALRYYHRAQETLRPTRYVRGKVLLALAQAVVLVQRGRLRDAARLYQQALEQIRAQDMLDVEGFGAYGLGDIHLEQGYVLSARKHLMDALRLFRLAGTRRLLPLALDDLTFLFLSAGDWTRARGFFHLFEKEGNADPEFSMLEKEVLRLWFALGQSAVKPLIFNRELETFVRLIGDRSRPSLVRMHRLVFLALLLGDPETFQILSDVSLLQNPSRDAPVRFGQTLVDMQVHASAGQRENFRRALARARRFLAPAGSPLWRGFYLVARGRAHFLLGNPERARQSFEESEVVFRRLGCTTLAHQVEGIRTACGV